MTKEECKQRVTAAIQAHKEEIFSLAESVFCEPELGFKETKTAAKIARAAKRATPCPAHLVSFCTKRPTCSGMAARYFQVSRPG